MELQNIIVDFVKNEAFKKELNALCEKYKCSLFVGDTMIKVD